jgi:hypothetical protein
MRIKQKSMCVRKSHAARTQSSIAYAARIVLALGPLDQPLLESILREVIIAIQQAQVHASEAGGQPIGGIVAI